MSDPGRLPALRRRRGLAGGLPIQAHDGRLAVRRHEHPHDEQRRGVCRWQRAADGVEVRRGRERRGQASRRATSRAGAMTFRSGSRTSRYATYSAKPSDSYTGTGRVVDAHGRVGQLVGEHDRPARRGGERHAPGTITTRSAPPDLPGPRTVDRGSDSDRSAASRPSNRAASASVPGAIPRRAPRSPTPRVPGEEATSATTSSTCASEPTASASAAPDRRTRRRRSHASVGTRSPSVMVSASGRVGPPWLPGRHRKLGGARRGPRAGRVNEAMASQVTGPQPLVLGPGLRDGDQLDLRSTACPSSRSSTAACSARREEASGASRGRRSPGPTAFARLRRTAVKSPALASFRPGCPISSAGEPVSLARRRGSNRTPSTASGSSRAGLRPFTASRRRSP